MSYRALSTATALAICAAVPAQAVFFHIGSGSIDGSLCVGNDCVASPAFGFDTVILRENNLRLFFDDTSTAAAFPQNDWRLYANDSANGGSSYFGVEDATAGRFVFRVFAGARSNAMVIDAQGDLGLGTTTPATDIDIKIGDTPTVRLQQDGTSGFTPQTWDVAGNEAGFFIRDATGGSTLPFRIITGGAPSQSLVIDGFGQVGIGAGTNPEAPLEINASAPLGFGNSLLKLANSGGAAVMQFDGSDNGTFWNMSATDATMLLTRSGTGTSEFTLTSSGDLTITGNLITGGGGTCDPGPCDAVFDPAVYTVPSIEEHAALMWDMQRLPALDLTLPGEPINVTLKLTRMLNELEHAHIYIAELHERLEVLEAKLARMP